MTASDGTSYSGGDAVEGLAAVVTSGFQPYPCGGGGAQQLQRRGGGGGGGGGVVTDSPPAPARHDGHAGGPSTSGTQPSRPDAPTRPQAPQQQHPQHHPPSQQQHGGNTGGNSNSSSATLHAAAAAAGRLGDAPFPITWLLSFCDPAVESAYTAYSQNLSAATDLVHLSVQLVLMLLSCARHLPVKATAVRRAVLLPPLPPLAAAIAAAQAAAMLAALLRAPRVYARWRGPAVAGGRLYRLAAWLLFARDASTLRGWSQITTRIFLLSPASGNLWFALFFPLPLDTHLTLLLVTTAAAVARGAPLAPPALVGSGAELPPKTVATYERLSRLTRYLDLPSHRLATVSLSGAPSPADVVFSISTFVAVVYGLVLPLALLYLREVHVRVRFLAWLQPMLSPRQVAATRHTLYSTTLSVCFVLLSLVPCVWGVAQLIPRFCFGPGGLRPDGVALVVTVLALQVFIRVYILAVLSLVVTYALREALLWAAGQLAWLAERRTSPGAQSSAPVLPAPTGGPSQPPRGATSSAAAAGAAALLPPPSALSS